jgi:multimeric flavodoxin WrbA
MKVLLINGSANEKGCTFTALSEIVKVFDSEGIESEIIQIGHEPIRDCCGCAACRKLENQCVFKDDPVNEIINKAKEADGFIFGSPVYYAHPSGRILSLLDRLFYAGSKAFAYKPGASVVSARRAGTTASVDVLNKYFTINRMPVVSSQYWNMVHGHTPEDVMQDKEGLQTMRTLGKNMAWLLKCIEAGKKAGIQYPEAEEAVRTNFIR